MNKSRVSFLLLCFTFGFIVLLVQSQYTSPEFGQGESAVLEGSPYSSIEETIKASEYQIRSHQEAKKAVYQAPNRAQGLRTLFDNNGIEITPRIAERGEWVLTMQVSQIGDGTHMTAVKPAILSASGNQITYDRGDIVEWYINNERGLEQGFTIETHPAGQAADTLVIDIQLNSDLTGYVNEGQSIEFISPRGEIVLEYSKLFAFDADARPLEASMQLLPADRSGQTLRLVVDTATAKFPILVDPLTYTPDWMVASTQDDQLGISVSTAGDVNNDGYDDVIVGASAYDTGAGANHGAAFVFLGSANGLTTAVHWNAFGTTTGSEFGYAVSEAGDVNNDGFGDVIIGAPGSSQAYIYHGSSTGLSSSPNRVINQQSNSAFGFSVSNAGDVNDDKFGDVIIGAPDYKNGAGDILGRAYVFYGETGGILGGADWIAQIEITDTEFGFSVAHAGDVNNDDVDDIIIGDPAYSGDGELELAVVFHGARGTGLKNGPLVTNPIGDSDWFDFNPIGNDADFGFSVSGAGDVNNDGFGDVVVGAPNYIDQQGPTGAAHVYLGPLPPLSGSPPRITILGFTVQGASSLYGYSVAAAGDIDNDGIGEIIIGAPGYESIDGGAGKAATMGLAEPVIGAVEIIGGVNDPAPSSLTFLWLIEGDAPDAMFGASVDTAGDTNGDNYADIILGAPTYSGPGVGDGRAFSYHGTGPITGLSANNDGPTQLGNLTLLTADTTSPESGLNNFVWDFGDGNMGSGQIVTHQYAATGFYTATVTASNSFSSQIVATTLVNVTENVLIDPINGGSATFSDGMGNSTGINVPGGAVDSPILIQFTALPIDGQRGGSSVSGIEQPLPSNHMNYFFDLEASETIKAYLPALMNQASIPSEFPSAANGPLDYQAPFGTPGGTCDPDHFCFSKPVTLVIQYNQENVGGFDEEKSELWVWDENIQSWIDATLTCENPEPPVIDTEANTITLQICHISRFGVVGFN